MRSAIPFFRSEEHGVQPADWGQGEYGLLIVFNVEETLKGKLGKTVEVRADTSTTCGFGIHLKSGDQLLMFASGAPLSTDAMAGNIGLEDPVKAKKSIATVRALLSR